VQPRINSIDASFPDTRVNLGKNQKTAGSYMHDTSPISPDPDTHRSPHTVHVIEGKVPRGNTSLDSGEARARAAGLMGWECECEVGDTGTG
jgi:hypothetical protein